MAVEAMEIRRVMRTVGPSDEQPRFLLSSSDVSRSAFQEREEAMVLSMAEKAAWVRLASNRLHELGTLVDDWDSYGARPVDSNVLSATFELLFEVMRDDTPLPWIVPVADGHMQIEWHTHGIDLEVEIFSKSGLHMFYEDMRSGLPALEQSLDYDIRPLVECVGDLTRRTRLEPPTIPYDISRSSHAKLSG